MEIKRSLAQAVFAFALAVSCVCAQEGASGGAFRSLADDSYMQGLACYRSGDWADASVLLRHAAQSGKYSDDSVWFMIIMSQIYAEDFSSAVSDCGFFISAYPESPLAEAVAYQKGRALYCAGQRDLAVMELGSFCSEWPESRMYASALFWIAECFYDDYDFETARALYSQILRDYPGSAKHEDAQFKLYLITQRDREQKLLYLLKVTGEEFLSAKESYEKELRYMQSEDAAELKRQLRAANSRIRELEESALSSSLNGSVPSSAEAASVQPSGGEVPSEMNEELYSLKRKSALIQSILDEKYGGK